MLLGIREDALWMLDQRLGLRIPNLLGNTLAVSPLMTSDARGVIEAPIARWNEIYAASGVSAGIEDALVDTLIAGVQSRNIRKSDAVGTAHAKSIDGDSRIEIAFLQLVLEALWTKEAGIRRIHLTVESLNRMNEGHPSIAATNRIVQTFVDNILAERLDDSQRDICSRLFPHLVTPSGTKFAQATGDLIGVGSTPGEEVREVLRALTADSGSGKGLLKRLSNPEKYEIAHDVLAQPILDWRIRHTQRRHQEAEERRLLEEAERTRREQEVEIENARKVAEVERRSATRLRWMMRALIVAVTISAIVLLFAYLQNRRRLDAEEAAAQAMKDKAAEQLRARAAVREKEAADAAAKGEKQRAELLQNAAHDLRSSADTLTMSNQRALQESETEIGRLRKTAGDAAGAMATLKQQLEAANEARQKAEAEAELKAIQSPPGSARVPDAPGGRVDTSEAGLARETIEVRLHDHNGDAPTAGARNYRLVLTEPEGRVTSYDFLRGSAFVPKAVVSDVSLDRQETLVYSTSASGSTSNCRATLRSVRFKFHVGCLPSFRRLNLSVPETAPTEVREKFGTKQVMEPVTWNSLSPEKRAQVLLSYTILRAQPGWSVAAGGAPSASLWDHVDIVAKVDPDKLTVRLTSRWPSKPPSGMGVKRSFEISTPGFVMSTRSPLRRQATWSTDINNIQLQVDLLKDDANNWWFAQIYLTVGPGPLYRPPPSMSTHVERLAVLHQEWVWRSGTSPGFKLTDN